jgi:hypothetical protein
MIKTRCDGGTEYVAVKLLGLAIRKLEASGSYFRLETWYFDWKFLSTLTPSTQVLDLNIKIRLWPLSSTSFLLVLFTHHYINRLNINWSKINVFRNMTLHGLGDGYQHLEEPAACVVFYGLLWRQHILSDICSYLPECTVSQPRTYLPRWESTFLIYSWCDYRSWSNISVSLKQKEKEVEHYGQVRNIWLSN